MKVYNNWDFGGLAALNMRLHPLASAPSGPAQGQVYTSTVTGTTFIWNGTAWRPTDAAALSDASIPMAALAVDTRQRSTHLGTQTADTISDLATVVKAYRLSEFAAPNAAVSFGGQRITTVATPTTGTDAANRDYVDTAMSNALAGVDAKPSVRAVAVGNITLSGTQTIDGVAVVAGNRVLAAGQTAGAANGVYIVAAGAWTRATDADGAGEITPGAEWFVEEGTASGATSWRVSNTGTVTLGTTALSIVQRSAGVTYTAQLGVQLVGTTFSILLPANSGLVASGAGLAIDTSVVARKFAATVTGDGATSSFAVTHNLGTQDVVVMVKDSTGAKIIVDTVTTSSTVVTITFGVAPVNGNAFRVIVIG